MLKRLHISNYKSIYNATIELGRFNVFIGENGSGKTNILEALSMASAAAENKLSNDELALKGIRVAKPTITFSSFSGKKQKKEILIEYEDDTNFGKRINHLYRFSRSIPENIFSKWEVDKSIKNEDTSISGLEEMKDTLLFLTNDLIEKEPSEELKKEHLNEIIPSIEYLDILDAVFEHSINDFQIFNLSTKILRGIGGQSRAIPGIQGENLDRLIESFNKEERAKLEEYAYFITWLDKIEIDSDDSHKRNGHKLDLSTSLLYFRDKYMHKKNNLFSAENANEGVLHILFYLALFISQHTPKLFGIDNIETALNPELCRKLTEQLVKLSKETERQVLITTHGSSVLEGLDLDDDEQRLFKVYRNRKGHTKVKRVQ